MKGFIFYYNKNSSINVCCYEDSISNLIQEGVENLSNNRHPIEIEETIVNCRAAAASDA